MVVARRPARDHPPAGAGRDRRRRRPPPPPPPGAGVHRRAPRGDERPTTRRRASPPATARRRARPCASTSPATATRSTSVEPARAGPPRSLDGCKVLVVAGPTEKVPAEDVARFTAYLDKGGTALVAAGPGPDSGDSDFLDLGLGELLGGFGPRARPRLRLRDGSEGALPSRPRRDLRPRRQAAPGDAEPDAARRAAA